ncbi:hypothetical protein A1Q2_02931 [Trichosporon asahii var. asahii CBS 8904]|uniref:Magnesium transporter n=1 Tax=Trichosporon asahii var. asahii (strain CBS 8904) TaxID=1220162 RepID=K1VQ25_TRIAC|nr:hypothetical protein A1Q2_02931 [Trichosporon asahii var. asahii CBS 8904]
MNTRGVSVLGSLGIGVARSPCVPARPLLRARSVVATPKRFKTTTSFWSTSYPAPVQDAAADKVPPPPPLPAPSAVTQAEETDRQRARRQQRYLDSLMNKAGEVGLQSEEGKYKKMDLCRAHDLDPRDLRKLDSITPSLVPVILTTRSCILISILHLKALIKPDRVIIFNPPGYQESEAARRFKEHLQENVRAGLNSNHCGEGEEEMGLPYEHRALESILVDTANALEEEMGFIRRLVKNLLQNLETDINRENLRKLLHYSRRLAGFQSRAKSIKSAFDELLDSDEDLSAMYITDKLNGRPRALHDHAQLELLLESFTKQVEEIVSEIDTTAANMQSTQEIAELMLDSGRNALLALDIKVSIATLGIGTGALVAGLFGMNLTTTLEDSPWAFAIVSGITAFIAACVFGYGSRVLRKVRHIALVSKPTSLPESVREAKERFVRERLDRQRAIEAERERIARETQARTPNNTLHKVNLSPIPDYEERWTAVRMGQRKEASLWDRLFRPNKLRKQLLGMPSGAVTASSVPSSTTGPKKAQPTPAKAPTRPATKPEKPSATRAPALQPAPAAANAESK